MRLLKIFLTGIFGMLSLLMLSARTGAGLEISYIRPNPKYEFGFMLKPAPGFAITTRSDNEYRLRWGVSFGYVPFKTTMEAFPVFKYNSSNENGNEVYYIGEQRFKNNLFNLFFANAIGEFKILKTQLSPIIGLEFRMNMETFTYSTYYPDYYEEYSEDSHLGLTWSLFPKAGLVYDMEEWTFQLTAGYNWDIAGGNSNGTPYTAVSLSVIYYFK